MKKEDKKQVDEIVDHDEEVTNEAVIEKFQQQIQELELTSKRYLADYQNLVRRVQEEKISWIRNSNKDLLLKLLPVLDTLMLAVKHNDDKGLAITVAQFEDVLKGSGVTKVKTVGEAFDPNTMECVTTEEVTEKKDIVLEEIRTGYLLGDTVLRSAQVIVGI